jgi:transcriptional regulator with XRE-family HTH domain
MVFRSPFKVLPKNMTAIAATICRIPNARLSIPAAIGVSSRTVENWLSGSTEPRAGHLIALMRAYAEVTDDVLKLAERQRGGLTEVQKSKLLEAIGEK